MNYVMRVIAIVSVFACGHLSAQSTVFTNESEFLSATANVMFESFEELTATNPSFPGDVQLIVLPDFEIMNNSNSPNLGVTDSSFSPVTDGDQSITWYAMGPATQVTFSFNEVVDAFGIDIVDWGDFSSEDLMFFTDTGVTGSAAAGSQADGNVQFFGLTTETSFSEITFVRNTTSDALIFDATYYGSAVPEPTSVIILIMGCAGLASVRRR